MRTLENLERICKSLEPISLSEMDTVALMNRTDTKFMLDRADVESILDVIGSDFRILEVEGIRMNRYQTLYYDTKELQFFRLHLNGKYNRYKMRNRKYVESDLAFLEVKFKNNKGRTIKQRVVVEDQELNPSASSRAFIEEVSGISTELLPTLWSNFTRITLVNKHLPERMTIDTKLFFSDDNGERLLNRLCIVELKQERMNRHSPFMKESKKRGLRPIGCSKYCLGIAYLRPEQKTNILKPKLRHIQKIEAHVVD